MCKFLAWVLQAAYIYIYIYIHQYGNHDISQLRCMSRYAFCRCWHSRFMPIVNWLAVVEDGLEGDFASAHSPQPCYHSILYVYIYKAKMSVCVYVCPRISCQWLISEQNQWLISEQNQWHIWNQQVPACCLAWF